MPTIGDVVSPDGDEDPDASADSEEQPEGWPREALRFIGNFILEAISWA